MPRTNTSCTRETIQKRISRAAKHKKSQFPCLKILSPLLPPRKRRSSLKQNQQLCIEVICPPSFSSVQLKARCQLFHNKPPGFDWPMTHDKTHALLFQGRALKLKSGVSREASAQDMSSAPQISYGGEASQWDVAFSKFITSKFITVMQEVWHTSNPWVTPASPPAVTRGISSWNHGHRRFQK